MYLAISGVLFAIYFLNVLLGSQGISTYLSDIQEMLTLLAAVIFFVLAILKREAAAKESK